MFSWNSLAFSVIQKMLAIWSLVPLPFLKPAWTSGSSQLTYCWSLTLRILSIALLVCAAAAAAKLLQLCPTLCDPIDGSQQAPLSLGFSRQEHWSGLPFPSPMHESENWKRSHSVVSNSSLPHGPQPTRLLRPWDIPGKSTGVGCHCLLRRLGEGWTNYRINVTVW